MTSKKSKEAAELSKKDPTAGLMDMMKVTYEYFMLVQINFSLIVQDLYDSGDENMKKVIGEAMMKAQRGEKSAPPSMDDL